MADLTPSVARTPTDVGPVTTQVVATPQEDGSVRVDVVASWDVLDQMGEVVDRVNGLNVLDYVGDLKREAFENFAAWSVNKARMKTGGADPGE